MFAGSQKVAGFFVFVGLYTLQLKDREVDGRIVEVEPTG